MLATTLVLLLLSSINYQLNLGYLLTFLLAGTTVVGMYVSHATLRGLTLATMAPAPQFAGCSVGIEVRVTNPDPTVRRGIGLGVAGDGRWTWTDVPQQGGIVARVAWTPRTRGLHPMPALTAETRFPLGTFRVWTVWRPASSVLVFPAPEIDPPPLPPGRPTSGGAERVASVEAGQFDGVRAYRRGDAMKLVVWKKFAKAGQLVSRDAQRAHGEQLWLDLALTGLAQLDRERQLSRLSAWVLRAEEAAVDYGLRLPAVEIAPSRGLPHRNRCLEALARC